MSSRIQTFNMKILLVPLGILLAANVYLWWSFHPLASIVWAVCLISSPKLIAE